MPESETVKPCDCGQIVPDGEHHCWMHHTKEAEPDESVHIICGECWHVYRTAADLEAAYLRVITEMNQHPPVGWPDDEEPIQPRKAEDIHFCQECIHDF